MIFSRAARYSTGVTTKYNPVRSAWKQKLLYPEGLIHNPAPAAPSAYDTPAAFLPKEDKRTVRKDDAAHDVSKLPQIGESPLRTYHLTAADAEEIQRLRHADPEKWTRKALAKHFKVSGGVIGLVSKPEPARDAEMQQRLAQIKSQWSEKRARARKHREQRKLWALADA